MLYITNEKLYPLQYFLYKIYNSIAFSQQLAQETGRIQEQMPHESYKLAMTVITIGPVILFYPFVQKYFIKGMTVGAIKG
jgi:putative aldouronate transport system permease protein